MTEHARQLQDLSWKTRLARRLLPPRAGTRLIWHVGYARTSTTWLQEGVYPRFPRLNYLGIRYLKSYHYQYDLVTSLAVREEGRYDAELLRRELRPLMRRDQPNLFSSEGLLIPDDVPRTVARFQQLLPECENHFLFSIRRQDTHFFSRYAHDLPAFSEPCARQRGLPPGTFPAYRIEEAVTTEPLRCRWPDCRMTHAVPLQLVKSHEPCSCLERGFKPISHWFYDIASIAGLFAEAFGLERVHFILLEETALDPGRTIDRLAQLCGITLSLAERTLLSSAQARNTLENNSGETLNTLRAAYRAPGGLAEQVRERYRASNRRLQTMFPHLPLAEFGYL